ncbi:AMP-binding protein [Polymorphobacter fuscus]|uniref:acetate--CoA ligase n=1 Tax=Sandarakinorhabdus fusca TaxID=1439888 RepID=A0A7C9KY43_9SPHN|nr:AMP-binding protein [Polymorphobacter fuscus]KAB7648919.1 AMP-binding protein [Polymorphobacter fuscus]MQT16508.1 AMP-binding protein [Polymorphobacter fuscus]NJC07202.1 acrylyl-CoA reductase (NADPH)/3-hydroxypropionyl-CoA dehydratase/3-hydroxypropionyl-CoA synthetase [Polymorphobacter fuscus]
MTDIATLAADARPARLEPVSNPIRTRADWDDLRAAVVADPGAVHGAIAARNLHWLVPLADGTSAWLAFDGTGWSGWDAATAAPVTPDLAADFAPWTRAFNDDDAPHFRWFDGARTNCGFNEVDRHVLAGHGDETAFIFEGDRWDMAQDQGRGAPVDCYGVSRKRLLLETAKCAIALKNLGLKAGDRIALNMPNIPAQLYWTEAAKRIGVLYTPVFGGFSDKTLSDRIHDAGARIVITADGGYRMAQIVPFKTAYTDPALDNYVPVQVALRLLADRLAGDDLGLSAEMAAAMVETVSATLKGEVTVERGDVMRGVGRALAELGKAGTVDSTAAARIRIAVAESLVATPPRVDAVVVARHTGQPDIVWRDRDLWSHDLTNKALAEILAAAGVASEAELLALPDTDFVRAIWAAAPVLPVDAEYPMFFIYTSGSTGKPKGVVHVHGGYAAGIAETMKVAFDARPGDVLYVVADPGWITGQSYMISAPLLTRVTTVLGEGAPVFPHSGRFAAMIERHGVTIFKAGVTFLKAVMSDPQNLKDIQNYDMGGLRVATFCAEPCSPPVQAFGMANVTPQYINSYWATEHGGIAWTHFYGNDDFPLAADARTFPLPWIVGDVWVEDEAGDGQAVAPLARAGGGGGVNWRRADVGEKGEIVIAAPYPYLARTVWGDPEHFTVVDGSVAAGWKGDAERWDSNYWRRWNGVWAYTQGDFAVRHADDGFSLHGRSDDVINVSGHRMGTEEIEGAILRDKQLDPDSPLGNVLVVGAPHREKGLTPIAFVTAAPGQTLTRDDFRRLSDLVRQEKGAVAVPGDFIEVSQFPETRSGKYMRRMVRAIVEGGDVGDVTTLRNPESLDELKKVIGDWQRRQSLSEDQQIFDRYRYFRIQYNEVAPGQKVATVFVTNPPVNALNERAIDELVIVVEHLSRRDDVVAVVFTGDGTASFVAGADIRQFLDEIHTIEEARVLPNNAQLAFARIESMGKPCVAAIQGVALGGGMEFALACHWRVAEAHARFGQPEIRLRLLPGYGGTQRLPRLLAEKRGPEGLRDALDLILGGRSIDGEAALEIGLVETLATGADDALGLAHAAVREFVRHGENSKLGRVWAERRKAAKGAWQQPAHVDLDEALADDFVQRILRQLEWAGRATAGERAIAAIRAGWTEGMAAGLEREAQLFAEAVVDPQGGKTGIREFLDKKSPPLPVRRNGVFIDSEHDARAERLEAAGDLLPVGAPFFPGVTAIPGHQYAFGIARDADTGAPRFGQPATHERELIVPVPAPEPNEALVYLLTSEVNFNDIWALTGIPVSPFDGHEEDFQTTGSGGLALIAALGSEARGEGRLKVGDMVAVYSGTSDLLSPAAGRDPMFADFSIQGYETKTGSHAQFLTVQAPQLHAVPGDLTLEQAGSYILNLGTIVRCLFTTLEIVGGKTIFIEGSATGTGLDALKSSKASGLAVTGLVSSPARAEFVTLKGAVGAIDRTDARFAALYTPVPDGAEASRAWEAAGAPLVAEYKRLNNGKLADYAVSHAGETSFPRSFQLLAEGGKLAFYGASSGYHLGFMGKPGASTAEAMLQKAGARGGEAILIFYGPNSTALADETGLEMIEAARGIGARTVVVTTTDGQREFILSLGFEDAVAGVVSLEGIKRREGANFEWPDTMPRLPVARADIEAFREAVREFQDKTLKPFGSAVGKLLRSPDNPRGAPDIVLERAGQDTLGVTSALVKPFTGRIVYAEDMAGQRYNFYAPQVWTRQRRIIMPTAEILGTHLCNAYEVTRMNDMVAAGLLDVTEPTVVPWEGLPEAHQSMWDNRHSGATYIVNHALPASGLRSRDELYEAWAAEAPATSN